MRERKVLVIDDDLNMLELLRSVFAGAGYQVFTAANGPQGLYHFYTHSPDLIILDLMMPEMDGWEVCQRIRQLSDIPLILVTALNHETHIVDGLDRGADDYIVKPFSPQVLLARSRAVLRKKTTATRSAQLSNYSDGYLTLDLAERQVFVHGRRVKLSRTEYQLLSFLVSHAGQVLTIEQLLIQIWGLEQGRNAEYIHAYIYNLRQKLEPDPHQPTYILTEHGVGYLFEKQSPLSK